MSAQKNTEAEDPFALTAEELAEKRTHTAPTTPKKLPWPERYRFEMTAVAIIAAGAVIVGAFMNGFERDIEDAVKASNIESAYTDVALQTVAVNGYRGTEEWRGFYKLGLERYFGQHDFSDLCTPNGFLKDSYVAGALPCIAVDDKRAVRAYDGSISLFKEDTWRRMTHPLDVMEQDVHADGYVDIDAVSKAVEDRASKQKADEVAAAEKATKQAKAADENQRAFDEATKALYPIVIRPRRSYADPADAVEVPTPSLPDDPTPMPGNGD
jgi:hypothetical protein